ncbi:hypothetical protein [Streptomyces specialis]|uniref:hypothetical protein n=1 Tax=Streptomyces specialis TaxID=498367 RepID=UPI00073F87D5|nr:hypothetical protein [Streptomyces specialis]
MGKREPNAGLAKVLRETGMTGGQLARGINRVAGQAGMSVSYAQPSVSNWLAGTLPRREVRPFVVEVLSARLGRVVTHAELGFPAPTGDVSARAGIGICEELVDLARGDMDPDRRELMGAALFSAALPVPGWHDVVGRVTAVRSGRARRIGMADVDVVTAVTEQLAEVDNQFGGRHARPLAVGFLLHSVTPYLQAGGTDDVRKAMLSAAARLCDLTGFMAVDEHLHGLAQRYYGKALELAGAAENPVSYRGTLRMMSVQALDLGHATRALGLAEAAWEGRSGISSRMESFLAGQVAHTHAVAGNRKRALDLIRVAETALGKAEDQDEGFGPGSSSYSRSSLTLHLAEVRNALGDVAGSVESLTESARLRTRMPRRRNGIRYRSLLAERQLRMGHLEAACRTWDAVLDDYPFVRSGSADRKIADARALLRPYRHNRFARAVYERARGAVRP